MAHSHFIPSKSQKRLYMYANYMLFGDCFPSPLFSLTMSSVCVCVCVCVCVHACVCACVCLCRLPWHVPVWTTQSSICTIKMLIKCLLLTCILPKMISDIFTIILSNDRLFIPNDPVNQCHSKWEAWGVRLWGHDKLIWPLWRFPLLLCWLVSGN